MTRALSKRRQLRALDGQCSPFRRFEVPISVCPAGDERSSAAHQVLNLDSPMSIIEA